MSNGMTNASQKSTEYTAGEGISISNGVISCTAGSFSNEVTKGVTTASDSTTLGGMIYPACNITSGSSKKECYYRTSVKYTDKSYRIYINRPYLAYSNSKITIDYPSYIVYYSMDWSETSKSMYYTPIASISTEELSSQFDNVIGTKIMSLPMAYGAQTMSMNIMVDYYGDVSSSATGTNWISYYSKKIGSCTISSNENGEWSYTKTISEGISSRYISSSANQNYTNLPTRMWLD